MTIQFTHFDSGARFCVRDVEPREGNVFSQHRGARSTGDYPHLCSSNMNTVAVRRRLIPFKFEADKLALGVGFSFYECVATDEVIFF